MYIGNKRVLGVFQTIYEDTPTQEKSLDISENGEYEVIPDDKMALSKVNVNVDIPVTPTQEKSLDITENGEYEVIPDDDKVLSKVEVNVNIPVTLEDKEITENGTYTASEGYDGLGKVVVNIPEIPTQEKTVDITENGVAEIMADEGYTLSKVTANVNVGASGENNTLVQIIEGTLTDITPDDLRGVTILRSNCFNGYSKLLSIELPDTVTTIGFQAFQSCTNLKTITIGAGLNRIENYAFGACDKLERLNIDSLEHWCNITLGTSSFPLQKKGNVYVKNVSGDYELITNIIIPNTVTKLCNELFYNWGCVTSIVIPDSVTSIGKSAFYNCSITSIVIPDSVTSIGTGAFYNCIELTNIILSNNITKIDSNTFKGCTKLTSLTIPSSVTDISRDALFIGSETNKATITFLSNTPPSISSSCIKLEYLEKIIVPKGCGDVYKSATNFANYADYIEEMAE